jgi:hypothetical protein
MKSLRYSLLLIALVATGAAAQTAAPQPSTERGGSPYDRNPACRDRDVSSADPACVIQDGPSAYRPLAPQAAPPVQVQPQQSNAAPPVIIVVPPQGSPARP